MEPTTSTWLLTRFRFPASTLGNFPLWLNAELLERTSCSFAALPGHRAVRKGLFASEIVPISFFFFFFWLQFFAHEGCSGPLYKHLIVIGEYKDEGGTAYSRLGKQAWTAKGQQAWSVRWFLWSLCLLPASHRDHERYLEFLHLFMQALLPMQFMHAETLLGLEASLDSQAGVDGASTLTLF